jgi:ABC-type nitrate/sulfonate/bicarbonate transport system substrate-binding protein
MTRTAVSYTRCPGVPTISAIGHQLGLIQQEFDNDPGLAFEYKSVGFSPKIDYGHDDRFWIRNAGHAPAVWKKSKGVDCKVIGLAWLDGSYPVLSLKSSGIDSVAALRGKRLAILRRGDNAFDLMVSQQLKIFQTTLSTAGLTLDDVELVEINQTGPAPDHARTGLFQQLFLDRIAVLESGKADVVAATAIPPDAGAFPALNHIYNSRLHPDPLARVHPSVLRGVVVSGPLLAERRDIVVRLLLRLLEAGDYALANPLEALRLVATDLKQQPEQLAASYESVAQGVQLDMGADVIAALDVQKSFLLQHKLIERDFDLADFIDPAPLAEARELYHRRAAA